MDKQKRFHLAFSFIMGAMMISLMTFIITAVNIGFPPDFVSRWLKSFMVAYVAGDLLSCTGRTETHRAFSGNALSIFACSTAAHPESKVVSSKN